MKEASLTCLFCCVLVAAVAFPINSESSEDPFDEKQRRAQESLGVAWDRFSDVLHEGSTDPDGLNDLLTALDNFEAAREALKPSYLDMLEARHRLLDMIHDGDDEMVFDLYTLANDYVRQVEQTTEMAALSHERLQRQKQNNASRGVDLIPEN